MQLNFLADYYLKNNFICQFSTMHDFNVAYKTIYSTLLCLKKRQKIHYALKIDVSQYLAK